MNPQQEKAKNIGIAFKQAEQGGVTELSIALYKQYNEAVKYLPEQQREEVAIAIHNRNK